MVRDPSSSLVESVVEIQIQVEILDGCGPLGLLPGVLPRLALGLLGRLARRDIDDDHGGDELGKRDTVGGVATFRKMDGRIDVRPGVCSKRVHRKRERVAFAHVLEEPKPHRRIALVDRRSCRIEGRRRVYPAAGSQR